MWAEWKSELRVEKGLLEWVRAEAGESDESLKCPMVSAPGSQESVLQRDPFLL
jgi:hypothetical protein